MRSLRLSPRLFCIQIPDDRFRRQACQRNIASCWVAVYRGYSCYVPAIIPFFEKAGMRKIMERFPDHEITEAIEELRHLGFEPTLLSSLRYNLEKLKNMNPMEIMKCREILAKLRSPRLHKFADSHAPYGRAARYRAAVEKASLEKLAKMLKALSFLAQTRVYMLWKSLTLVAKDGGNFFNTI